VNGRDTATELGGASLTHPGPTWPHRQHGCGACVARVPHAGRRLAHHTTWPQRHRGGIFLHNKTTQAQANTPGPIRDLSGPGIKYQGSYRSSGGGTPSRSSDHSDVEMSRWLSRREAPFRGSRNLASNVIVHRGTWLAYYTRCTKSGGLGWYFVWKR